MFNVFLCIATEHNWWLVALAAIVCLTARPSATFFLYSKVPQFPSWRRGVWLGMTGLVAGSGIWTTHFVAMLAFKTGLPTGYIALETLGSLAIAVISTTVGFAVGRPPRAFAAGAAAVCGGLIVGLGITLMHYVGMSGYRTAGLLHWNMDYVAASVLIGGLFSAAALFVARPRSHPARLALGALLLSLGIVGMHFTGMTAVTIFPDMRIHVPASLMSDEVMVVAAVAVTALILITAVGGVILDTANRNNSLRRFREALNVIPEGLAFYDAADQLVAWNTEYADLCRAAGAVPVAGMAFSELLHIRAANGAYPDAAGREDEWLAERQAAHRGGTPNLTLRTADGGWLRITERRTSDGGTVSVSVDITDLKQAEEAMAQARDRAEELAHRAEVAEAIAGLGHWRREGESTDVAWSPQMYHIYGLPLGSPLDANALIAMTHPDDADRVAETYRRQLAGDPHDSSLIRIVRADGEVRYLAGNSTIERGPDGEIVSMMGTVVDVTDQKLAEIAMAESEERFRRLAVNAPDMITESRLDGVLTYVSPASAAITGFSPEELLGRTLLEVMTPEDGQDVMEMYRTALASDGEITPRPIEFRTRHKDGHELWLECKPMFGLHPTTGRPVCLNDIVRDVTPRKTLEAQLRTAQSDAETAAAVKAEFLANMSHELRTPLTSILGFTGLAAEQPDLADLTRTYIERVADASRALLCTVNDILDFSEAGSRPGDDPAPAGVAGQAERRDAGPVHAPGRSEGSEPDP